MERVSPSALVSSIRSQLRILSDKNWMYWRFGTSITRRTADQLFLLHFTWDTQNAKYKYHTNPIRIEGNLQSKHGFITAWWFCVCVCVSWLAFEVYVSCESLHLRFDFNECNRSRQMMPSSRLFNFMWM